MQNVDYEKLVMKIKSFSMATIGEDGKPDSRIIDVMFVQDGKIYFLTAHGKNFYKQIMEQRFLSMTGMSRDWEALTIRGSVKQVSRNYLDRMFDENPSMHEMYPGDSRGVLEAFCLHEGQGELFDLSKVPVFRETFVIGNPEAYVEKGYRIMDICTQCGVCADVCPQKCIDEGAPYKIRVHECLHCGWCMENCPSDAIQRLGEWLI